MKQMTSMCLGLAAAMAINVSAIAEPAVPGFEVQIYAWVTEPRLMTFDPSGVLYVGNGAGTGPIRRVGIGGSPVEDYGPPLLDPDAVTFDAGGGISGTPGSVLVSGGTGSDAYVAAIRPDETAITVYPAAELVAPQVMGFDYSGRLIISDFGDFLVGTTEGLSSLSSGGNIGETFALDSIGRIFSLYATGTVDAQYVIDIIASNGDLVESEFAIIPEITSGSGVFGGLVVGPNDAVWRSHLFTSSRNTGVVYRINQEGEVSTFGQDFPVGVLSVAFGPDGALYVSSDTEGVVYRVTPAEVTFVPTDDAKLRSRSANKNFGRSGNLRVRHDEWESCLKFQVTTPSSDSATLRLYATDGSPDGGTIYQAANDWAESSVSYSSKPAIVSGPLDSAGAVFDDTWVELDVSSVVTGAGTYSFCLVSDSSNSVFYSSSERSQAPELVVEFEY